MRDLFDDFLEELRRREAAARGEDPGPERPRSPNDRGPEPDDDGDRDERIDDEPRRSGSARPGGQFDADATDAGDDVDAADESQADEDELPGPVPIDAGRRRTRGGGRRRPPGGPHDGEDHGSRAARAGRRVGLIAIIVAVIALFILLTVGIDLWTD